MQKKNFSAVDIHGPGAAFDITQPKFLIHKMQPVGQTDPNGQRQQPRLIKYKKYAALSGIVRNGCQNQFPRQGGGGRTDNHAVYVATTPIGCKMMKGNLARSASAMCLGLRQRHVDRRLPRTQDPARETNATAGSTGNDRKSWRVDGSGNEIYTELEKAKLDHGHGCPQ